MGRERGSPAHAGMDLRSLRTSAWKVGLPRTRGDGPSATVTTTRATWAPPHTRGWTVSLHGRARGGRGSPAHAGMDLATSAPRCRCGWLPRTRGDGPEVHSHTLAVQQAPPHTRGWTRCDSSRFCAHRGSPAHAGMDRRERRHGGPPQWLPRTRGDGPLDAGADLPVEEAPPHTRGWTRRGHPGARRAAGSPAHAGMDPPSRLLRVMLVGAPPHTRGWTRPADRAPRQGLGSPAHAGMDRTPRRSGDRRPWLPRTRGDGPDLVVAVDRRGAAPPHTRGWTSPPPALRAAAAGSPAHAGMDPRAPGARASGRGLPRTRGDGPLSEIARQRDPLAPPHTRGWTVQRPPVRGALDGSPAHAGMDRAGTTARASSSRLPRTRGDGPMIPCQAAASSLAPPHTRGWTRDAETGAECLLGSPAHAGMDPCSGPTTRACGRLPRTRGDGPSTRCRPGLSFWAPPHTRGWTPPRRVRHRGGDGSPAHAGMDPGMRLRRGVSCRLPRTRGDGPASAPRVSRGRWAPPHTRGWTRRGPRHRARTRGSPAHAGMDPTPPPPRAPPPGLPRTRGDGPGGSLQRAADLWAPPHTRGWTRGAGGTPAPLRGSPAHAGMDPRRGWPWAAAPRLPRTRGDGPRVGRLTRRGRRAPPHTRGWTSWPARRRFRCRGSPAHAGMDPGASPSRKHRPWLPRTRGDGPFGGVKANPIR